MSKALSGAASTGPSKIAGGLPKFGADDATIGSRTRIEQIVEVIDHCMAAKKIAEALGDKFLVYMLAMTIQESRASIRRAGTVADA